MKDHAKTIAMCARKSYWSLFKNRIDTYFFKTYLYDVNKQDKCYKEATVLFDRILKYNENDDVTEIAKEYWCLRRQILETKYSLKLNESGQLIV